MTELTIMINHHNTDAEPGLWRYSFNLVITAAAVVYVFL